MGLETAAHISGLVSSNPTSADGLSQGDDHLRLLKSTLQATFPNFTDTALNATQAALDAAAAAVTNGGSVIADAGAFFKTNTTDGITNPAAGEVDVKTGGVVSLRVTATTVTVPGALAVTGGLTTSGPIAGPGAIPIGGSLLWWEDTLPASAFGDYAWLNGQVIASANTRCPTLLARWTNAFGGNGTTTMGVPDLREVSPIGKSTMGGTTTPGRITNYVSTTLGGFIGACLHLLTTGEMPSHTHTATVAETPHSHNGNTLFQGGAGVSATGGGTGTSSVWNTTTASTGLTVANASVGGGTTHDNVSPGVVCNWVVRLA
jgi:microcystin-dependent protein